MIQTSYKSPMQGKGMWLWRSFCSFVISAVYLMHKLNLTNPVVLKLKGTTLLTSKPTIGCDS